MHRGGVFLGVAVLALVAAALAFAAGLPGIPNAYQPYRQWHKVNAKPIRPTPTTAHPARIKNVYASKRAVKGRYPSGTIVVKEGLTGSGERQFVSLIAVMRRIRGSDPEHGDWRFVEWSRSSARARFSEVARDATCWSCHSLARKTDWVYTTR